jgi:hypothetical protein
VISLRPRRGTRASSRPRNQGSIATTTRAVISAPQTSITPVCVSTRRRLVRPAVMASVWRCRIIGIATTLMA